MDICFNLIKYPLISISNKKSGGKQVVMSSMQPHIKWPIFFVITACCIFSDQWSKWAVVNWIEKEQHFIAITSFLNIVLVKNTGVSFGLGRSLEYAQLLFSVLSILIVCWLLVWAYQAHTFSLIISISLVIGGAIGNIIDRITIGGVIDFIDIYIGPYHWPAFNLADSYIVLGIVALLIDSFLNRNSRDKRSS